MTLFSVNWTVAHGVFARFSFLTNVANFKRNECCAQCFDANFNQLDSCARCFAQGLAFLEKSPISRTTTVSQSVLTPILRNRIVAQGVLHQLYLQQMFRISKETTVAECFDAYFAQQDSCAQGLRQFLAC